MNIGEQKNLGRMTKIRRADTGPELVVRSILSELGIKYHTQGKGLPGTPDIVNRQKNWAIFVNGCFWHGHNCEHGKRKSKTNEEFWCKKIQANRDRDNRKRHELESLGFLVLELWECESRNANSLKSKLEAFIKKAESRLELFRVDQEKNLVERRVKVGQQRSRKAGLPAPSVENVSPHDLFDQIWLRLRERPRPLRNCEGVLAVADLFSGCGGLSLGVREACRASGRYFRPILAADTSEASSRVYQVNFAPEHFISDPIESWIDGEFGAPATLREQRVLHRIDDVDIVVAGPPCQGHSNLNNHTRRNDERNSLCLKVVRFAELVQPKHVIIENVGPSVHDEKRSIHIAKEHLEYLGYKCDSVTVDLWKIGVPQLRKRHLLIASQEKQLDIESLIDDNCVASPRSIGWAIGDLQDSISHSLMDQPRKLSDENQSRIRWLFENNQYDLPNALRPKCHQGTHTYYAMYGRLKMEDIANTITTGFGSPGQGRYIHPARQRTLTAHEAARLQFFPDFFDFSSVESYKELSTMIGNAVPMKASYLITLALLQDD